MNKAPCKSCKSRFVKKEDGKIITCHMVCDAYKDFRKEKDEEYEARLSNSDEKAVCYNRMIRIEKGRRR